MFGRCGAGDSLSVCDVCADERCRQRPHSYFIAAIADRNLLPPGCQEKIIQRLGESADILAAHVPGRAIRTAPAALYRNGMGHAKTAPMRNRLLDGPAEGYDVHRDI